LIESGRHRAAESESLLELQRVNKMRRDFVANVSHELKTPATSLKLLAESLVDVMDEDPEQARFFAGQLKSETDRLAQLITDLLDLAKLESQEEVPNPRPVDVWAVVESVMLMMRPAAERKEIELATRESESCSNRRDCVIRGDETQLNSMFSNLVDNAIKYTPPGGRVEAVCEVADGEVVIHVSDTGIGIPESKLPRIFERFYRVDKARSKETGGTGLGLSIVKHTVENHGGRISVQSRPGAGTTFSVYLPRIE
jgi:signal transduction histidine kinase